MQLHELQRSTPQAVAKRIGRGGKRGKTSGKGHKGQTARAGNSTRPEMRDLIKKLPKLRGHGKNRARTVNAERVLPIVVNLSVLDVSCAAGDVLNPAVMVARGIVTAPRKRVPAVKILGTGTLTKAVTITGCLYSASAKSKIEAAGGTIQ